MYNNNDYNKQFSGYPHAYKSKFYKSYQLAQNITPTAENFISKRGNQCTRFIFTIPGIPTFQVLDFSFNVNTHILKVEENRFNEGIIDALDVYCFEHKDDVNALVKPIPTLDKLAVAQQAANKQMELDKLFGDLDENDNTNTTTTPNSQPQQTTATTNTNPSFNDGRFYNPNQQ